MTEQEISPEPGLEVPSPTVYDDRFYDAQAAGSLSSARIVLQALFDLYPINAAVDVGCGVAPWVRTALDLGASYGIGLDGDYVDRASLLVEPDRFRACDLERENLRDALPDGRLFDAVLCMEVAEHLAPVRAASFIAELCQLGDLVLFSAAVPGQGGTSHINEQWPEYWSKHFARSNFDCFDSLRPRLWHETDCEWWYLQNALIFARRDSTAWHAIARAGAPTPSPMPLVHPRKLEQLVRNEAGYTVMNRSLEARLAEGERSAAALEEQYRTTVAALREDIARREAEGEAAFEATRRWMLRIESEQEAAREAAEQSLAASRAALSTVQRQLAAALSSNQAQVAAYRQMQTEHERLSAEHQSLNKRLLSCQDKNEALTLALRQVRGDAEAARTYITALHASTSWRLTGPVRVLRRLLPKTTRLYTGFAR